MNKEEYLKKREEILETINCFNSVEDEVLKLFCLVNVAANKKIDGEEYFSKEYMKEKIARILNRIPIILDSEAKNLFCILKKKGD